MCQFVRKWKAISQGLVAPQEKEDIAASVKWRDPEEETICEPRTVGYVLQHHVCLFELLDVLNVSWRAFGEVWSENLTRCQG